MPDAAKIADAILAELKTTDTRTPQAWAALRRRLARVLEEQFAPSPLTGERLYTTHEIALLLQVDASSVAKWIDSGKLVAFRTPGRHRRVRHVDLERFCAQFGIPITGHVDAA